MCGGYNGYWTVTLRWRMRSSSLSWFPYHVTIRQPFLQPFLFRLIIFPLSPLFPPYKKAHYQIWVENQGICVPSFIKIAWKLWPLDWNTHPQKINSRRIETFARSVNNCGSKIIHGNLYLKNSKLPISVVVVKYCATFRNTYVFE